MGRVIATGIEGTFHDTLAGMLDRFILHRVLRPSKGTIRLRLAAFTGCRMGNYGKTKESGQPYFCERSHG